MKDLRIEMKENKLIHQLSKELEKLVDYYVPPNEVILLPTVRSKTLRPILEVLFVRGVYFLCSKKEIIYIGLSENIGARLLVHLHSFDKPGIVRIGFIRYKNDFYATSIEIRLIHYFKPKYNIKYESLEYATFPEGFNVEKLSRNIKETLGIEDKK